MHSCWRLMVDCCCTSSDKAAAMYRKTTIMRCSCIVLLVLFHVSLSFAFVMTPPSFVRSRQCTSAASILCRRPLHATGSNDEGDDKPESTGKTETAVIFTMDESIIMTEKEAFPDAEFHDFVLKEHRPLGCTVEESLAHPMEKHVFVAKVCRRSRHAMWKE